MSKYALIGPLYMSASKRSSLLTLGITLGTQWGLYIYEQRESLYLRVELVRLTLTLSIPTGRRRACL